MFTAYLNAKDWSDFEERFSAAAAFLAARSVKREFQWLQGNQNILTEWQTQRLAELQQLFPVIPACKYSRSVSTHAFKDCQHPNRVQPMICHRQNCPWTERQQNDNCWDV